MFRIDYVLPESSNFPKLWVWSVKVPTGFYELLSTDDSGRGLYMRRLPSSPGEWPAYLSQLLRKDEFCIPDNVTNAQSIELLETALKQLGWEEDLSCCSVRSGWAYGASVMLTSNKRRELHFVRNCNTVIGIADLTQSADRRM